MKIELWDMEGDKVLNLGKGQRSALHPDCRSILMSNTIVGNIYDIWAETKLYLAHPHIKDATACLNDIKKSLTLSQALLFDARCSHRKDDKRIQLYPNMPNGRAVASFKNEHTFLTKKFELKEEKFILTNQLTLQPETPHFVLQ